MTNTARRLIAGIFGVCLLAAPLSACGSSHPEATAAEQSATASASASPSEKEYKAIGTKARMP